LPHDAWPVGPAGPQKAVQPYLERRAPGEGLAAVPGGAVGAGGVKIPVDAPRVVVVVGGQWTPTAPRPWQPPRTAGPPPAPHVRPSSRMRMRWSVAS
jgi:hypothetical protein